MQGAVYFYLFKRVYYIKFREYIFIMRLVYIIGVEFIVVHSAVYNSLPPCYIYS